MSSKLFPTFSSIKFNVTTLILRYLINLELSFLQGDKYGSVWILVHIAIKFCHNFTQMLSFSIMYFQLFKIKVKVSIGLLTFTESSILFYQSMCLSLCLYQIVFYCQNSVVQFEFVDSNTSRSSLIIFDCFCYPNFLFVSV